MPVTCMCIYSMYESDNSVILIIPWVVHDSTSLFSFSHQRGVTCEYNHIHCTVRVRLTYKVSAIVLSRVKAYIQNQAHNWGDYVIIYVENTRITNSTLSDRRKVSRGNVIHFLLLLFLSSSSLQKIPRYKKKKRLISSW